MEKVKIICSLPSECDEKYAGGLWDLSAKIAFTIAMEQDAKMPIDTEDWGQEAIYNILRSMTVQGEREEKR